MQLMFKENRSTTPRDAATKHVRALRLPRRLTFHDLVQRAEDRLGTRIHFETTTLPGDLSAQFLRLKSKALLQTRTGLSDRSRMAGIMHELAHIFVDDNGCDQEAHTGLLTGRVAFRRSDLNTFHEQIVELVADDLALRTGQLHPRQRTAGIFK